MKTTRTTRTTKTETKNRHRSLLALPFLIAAACSSDPSPTPQPDPGKPTTPAPPRKDAGTQTADAPPASSDSGGAPALDAGPGAQPDAGPVAQPDAGPAAQPDAGPGAQPDAQPEATLSTCKDIMAAAMAFSESLEPAKKATALLPFDARKHYRFTPEPTRPGLPLANMTKPQQDRALALLKATLSDSGYQKAMLIRTLDNWLRVNVGQLPFGSNNYYVAIYGTPSALTNWAWHWEGHHASFHFTFVGCQRAASTPLMLGSEPAELEAAFESAPAGTRVLGQQEDLARSLAMMLAATPAKRALAIAPRGGRMLPNTPDKQAAQNPPGLPVTMMNPAEVERLKQLLAEIAGNVNAELARLRLEQVEDAGFDKLTFFWAGPLARNVDAIYYFRIQGPTFIFEHNVEWENHVHSAWRDFDGDFGVDLLQRHLKQYPHRSAKLYRE